jgi:hypothetical protein
MDDRTRETVLDPTYLQPGAVARGGAVALAAVGIGAGVLLACWGASLFFNTNNKRLDVLITKIEELAQRPDRTDEVVTKVDDLNRGATKIGNSIMSHLSPIEGTLEELRNRPFLRGNPEEHGTPVNGSVITTQVTVFKMVPHDNNSSVITGWVYANGASANQPPVSQYCYWSSEPLGGTTQSARVALANNSVQLPNIAPTSVPRLDDALKKCVWWRSGS